MRDFRREPGDPGSDDEPGVTAPPDETDVVSDTDVVSKLGDLAATAGLRRIAMLAWRDLDDPEAGGSELHASRVASLWAQAGIEVTMRTSHAAGHPQVTWRNGYRVIRKAGRYLVFPRAAFSEMMGWHGASDGLVEIWNGMPFFSPLWARRPSVAWLHHVHDSMWEMTLTPRLAQLGRRIEFDVAPLVYRGHADRHAVAVVEGRAGPEAPPEAGARHGRPARHRRVVRTRRRAVADAARTSPSAGSFP